MKQLIESVGALLYESKVWTADSTLKKLKRYAHGHMPDSKDEKRIRDIVAKGRDREGIIRLALKQARLIKNIAKAIRRGSAAEDFTGKSPTMKDVVSQIFFTRALELAGHGKMLVPSLSAKSESKPKWTPPAISSVPEDEDDWEMYQIPGSKSAAKSLSKVMRNALVSVGKNITPHKTDSANAKALWKIRERVDRAREKRADFGAADTETRVVMLYTFENYIKKYLDDWDFPKTFEVLGG